MEYRADHVLVEYMGMSIVIGRSSMDGALMVDIDTSEVEPTDAHPGDLVPRLVLTINDHSQQLDEAGNWVERSNYPPVNVLDHMADV